MNKVGRPARLGVQALACAALFATLVLPAAAAEQVPIAQVARRKLDVDVWINKDEGGIFRPGESMRVYFRSSADAYLLVYNIDTEGYIHLVYPYTPNDPAYVDGGRTYQIPSRRDPYDLVADGPAGIEYVVAVASPYPFRNLPWYLSSDRAGRPASDDEEVEDETDSDYIVGDPYVGIDRINRRICPPGREAELATSETYFYIERRVEYPRYVCADCHYGQPYFDPFIATCSVFDIRIDATWARYAPIRIGTVRPRFFYRIRPQAPTRYRAWKEQWSSLDGKAALRERFTPERERRIRPERRRYTPPEFRDLRRERTGRFWQGRDQVLKLRERRLQDIRARQEETRRRREVERGRERSEPTRREELERRERPRDRGKAQPPRERSEARERERPTNRGDGRREAEARRNEERRAKEDAKRQNEAKERKEEKRRDREDGKERGRDRDERQRGWDRGR